MELFDSAVLILEVFYLFSILDQHIFLCFYDYFIFQIDRDVVLGKRNPEDSKQDKIEILTALKKLGEQVS